MSDRYSVTTIDLLRHGEPEGGEMFRGSIDKTLTELGWQQMRDSLGLAVGQKGPWQRLIASPLLRCCQFAEQLAGEQRLSLQIEKDLREIHFGDWDGRSFDELKANEGDALRAYWHDPVANTPPSGEPIEQFQQRVLSSFMQVVERHEGQHSLLVIHGGVIRILLGWTLGMPLTQAMQRFLVPYASLSRIKIYHQAGKDWWPQLVFHGDRGELLQPQQTLVD